jgi:hypothetical protein
MSDNTFFTFNTSDFELKEKGEDVFVSGFISSLEVDENNEVTGQDKLLEKINDPNNDMAKNLSYKHKWVKKDRLDHENKLGVMHGKAVIKTNPRTNQPSVWAEYLLLKTSPYYNDAIYDIKNRGVSGFSIEFKDAKKALVKFGNTIANYLEDYFLGGVALVARPAVKSTHITNFYTKEIYFLDDEGAEKMEIKEENQTTEPQKQEPPKVDVPAPEVSKQDIDSIKKETDALKAQLEKEKQEVDLIKQNLEKQKIKQELEKLEAEKKVLVPVGEHKLPGTESSESQKMNEAKKDADDLMAIVKNKDTPVYDKVMKVLDETYKE